MRVILFLIFFLTITFTFAQKHTVYKGVIKDSKSKSVISFATVAIYNADKLIDGVSTDDSGTFYIKATKEITHFEISFIGYQKTTVHLSDITDPKKMDIKLAPFRNDLDEVVVESQRSTTQEMKIDRKVIHLGSDLQQSGATALEAFDQIMEIQTDISTGSISLRGSGNVKILIDGKPSTLGSTELLEQISASSILKIELITSPSARNQADGLSGIINIVLKKNIALGLNMNLSSKVGTNGYGYGIDGNYNLSWLNFRYNVSQARRKTINQDRVEQQFSTGGSQNYISTNYYHGNIKKISSGVDLSFNSKNKLSIDFDYTNNYHDLLDTTLYSNVSQRRDRIQLSSHTHNTANFNCVYKLIIDEEKHFLEMDVSKAKGTNTLPASDFLNDNFLFDDDMENEKYMNTAGLDYTFPIGDKTTSEMGISWEKTSMIANNFFKANQELLSQNEFNYSQDLLSIYALTKFNFGKLKLQTGLRFEQFSSDSDNTLNGQITKINLSDLFPSVHFSYKFSDEFTFNTGYSKRISRPKLRHVNPFLTRSFDYIRKSNPNLKPEYSQNFESNFLYDHEKINTSVSLFYRFRSDVIELLRGFDTTSLQTVTFDNIGNKHSYGIETDFSYKLFKFWKTQFSINYYHTKIDQDIYITWNQLYQSKAILKNSFNITSYLSADVIYNHVFEEQNTFYFILPRDRVDMAFRVKLFDNRLTANLRIVDVFSINLQNQETVTPEIVENKISKYQTQTFGAILSINYKLFKNK